MCQINNKIENDRAKKKCVGGQYSFKHTLYHKENTVYLLLMLSCVILTHNNEESIGSLLETLYWCDEKIVVDDLSTDDTREIAKKYDAVVIKHSLQDDFAAQRNIGLLKAKGDWVLFLDTDEKISDALREDIVHTLQASGNTIGYYFFRKDVVFGRELHFGETKNIRLLRLARKEAGKWKRAVHEVWDVRGEVKTFTTPLLHIPHPTVRSFLAKINRYTTINARMLYREGKRSNRCSICLYPLAKFFVNYICKCGFLDGNAGFVHAMTMAFHSFLTRAKLWELQQKHNT